MSTKAATSLNRILRVTASLLFEKGEDVPTVAGFLEGFVSPKMVRDWHDRYCEVNGIEKTANSKRSYRRMPMPPIDFNAIKLEELEKLAAPPNAEEAGEAIEPEW
jgi:hypothetical protein